MNWKVEQGPTEPTVSHRLTVTVYESGLMNVHDEQGRHAGGLCWDEMIGQITSLTHPAIAGKAPRYPMMTDAEWDERERRLSGMNTNGGAENADKHK